MKHKNTPILYVLPLVILLYLLHRLVFDFFKIKTETFHYSLEVLYLFFGSASFVVILILQKIKKKNFDVTGMAFLVTTSVKMVFCYVLLRPLLASVSAQMGIEKTNFFVLFVVFLAIETGVTMQMLNENHKNTEKNGKSNEK